MMMLPGVILLIVFSYIPMAGVIIAFQKFVPAKGMFGDQAFVGLENFKYVFNLPNFGNVIYNTVIIAVLKIILVPLVITILINELKNAFN